jgi:hypothetical protein
MKRQQFCHNMDHIVDIIENKKNSKEYVDQMVEFYATEICSSSWQYIEDRYRKRFGESFKGEKDD